MMSAHNENEKPAEARAAQPAAPVPEPFETETVPPGESPDFRENTERGYGWGV